MKMIGSVAQARLDGAQFLADVNSVCEAIADEVESHSVDHINFGLECSAQQIRKHDPKARSYGIVHQLIVTDPKRW